MIGWNENFNWTHDQFCDVVTKAFNSGDTRINLDCEHASYDNMKEMVKWAEEKGYHAEITSNRETVVVWK